MRPPRVDALQLSEEYTRADLASLSHYGDIRIPKPSVSRPQSYKTAIIINIKGQDFCMKPGDWLVVESFVARVMGDDEFREMYEPDIHA